MTQVVVRWHPSELMRALVVLVSSILAALALACEGPTAPASGADEEPDATSPPTPAGIGNPK